MALTDTCLFVPQFHKITAPCQNTLSIGVLDQFLAKIGESLFVVAMLQSMDAVESLRNLGSPQVRVDHQLHSYLSCAVQSSLARLCLTEFCDNDELCSEYHIMLDEEEKSCLVAIYDSDMNLNDEDFDSEIACINGSIEDNFSTQAMSKRIAFARCDSVGASAFDLLHLDEGHPMGQDRRRNMKLRKYERMSLFIAAAPDFQPPHLNRCYRLSETPTKKWSPSKATHFSSITESTAFSNVLSFLNEGDLIHSVSLVSTRFADVAAEALGNLMLVSVGCDPLRRSRRLSNESDHSDLCNNHDVIFGKSSVAKSMEKGWQLLMHQFPWAQFLSDGAFKRVYKVWNNYCGAYEAISVMYVIFMSDLSFCCD